MYAISCVGWVPVPPRDGCLIINAGDQITHWTNGALRSANHRVIVRPEARRPRYSTAFFTYFDLHALVAPLPLGIAAGLFLGKQLGVFGAVWIAVRLGIGRKLRGATWLQVYAVSMLCGIGFTMSLFIGSLAFPGNALLIEEAKIGILMGSLAAALAATSAEATSAASASMPKRPKTSATTGSA